MPNPHSLRLFIEDLLASPEVFAICQNNLHYFDFFTSNLSVQRSLKTKTNGNF